MKEDQLAEHMRASFEASLSQRVARSSRVNLQPVIPSHWFSAAASECHSMFVEGYFYGAISIAQAYVEALSKFLCEKSNIEAKMKPEKRWRLLHNRGIVTEDICTAAVAVLSDRNDFHHLNKEVESDHQKLEDRAEQCVNHLHAIESEVFAHSFEAGKIVPAQPERWADAGDGLTVAHLRQKW